MSPSPFWLSSLLCPPPPPSVCLDGIHLIRAGTLTTLAHIPLEAVRECTCITSANGSEASSEASGTGENSTVKLLIVPAEGPNGMTTELTILLHAAVPEHALVLQQLVLDTRAFAIKWRQQQQLPLCGV